MAELQRKGREENFLKQEFPVLGNSSNGFNLGQLKFPTIGRMTKSRHTTRYEKLLNTLRAARLHAGITQVDAAKHFGSHASFISKIESGERRIDVVELADFCKLYGVRLPQLLKAAGIE